MGVYLGSYPIDVSPVIVVKGLLRDVPVKAKFVLLARHALPHLLFSFHPLSFLDPSFFRGGPLIRIVNLSCGNLENRFDFALRTSLDGDTFVLLQGAVEVDLRTALPWKPLLFCHFEEIQALFWITANLLDLFVIFTPFAVPPHPLCFIARWGLLSLSHSGSQCSFCLWPVLPSPSRHTMVGALS